MFDKLGLKVAPSKQGTKFAGLFALAAALVGVAVANVSDGDVTGTDLGLGLLALVAALAYEWAS